MGVGSPEYWKQLLNQIFYVGKVSLDNGEVVAVVGPKVTSIQKNQPAAEAQKPPVMVDEVVQVRKPMHDYLNLPIKAEFTRYAAA
jgi:hypothetical protein